jgi:hypothetical protein
LETQKQLEPKYVEIRAHLCLSIQEAAQSATLALALLNQRSAEMLNPLIAFGIAVYGFIECSKAAPEVIAQ